MFPEEYPIIENEQPKEMISLIQKDDADGLASYLSKNPTIDITKQQRLKSEGYYCYLIGYSSSVSLINLCCFFGSLNCFKYFLMKNCTITQQTLEFSIAGGNQEIINTLKEKGHSFEKCLETSVVHHRYELTNWLLQNYECKPVSLPTCIEYYNFDALLYFLEYGHSIDETATRQKTCLHHAATLGHLPVVKYLIEKGANIEAKTSLQETPLHLACDKGQLKVVQYLIEKGANIEAEDKSGRHTPLFLACQNGNLPVVEYLIEKGANIEAKDFKQRTPLHFASFEGQTDVIKYLLSKGANRKAKDDEGQTPYDVICSSTDDESQKDTIKQLLRPEACIIG